jgi:TonB family protein
LSDEVNRVIAQRQALDRGFPRALWLSLLGHLVIVGTALAAPMLLPGKPVLRVSPPGRIVPLPPGGGGRPEAVKPAAPPARSTPQPQPPQVKKPEPPPKVIKPPKKQKRPSKGVPPPDARKKRARPKSTPTPAPATSGTGTSSSVPGLEFLPPGPGAPGGTDPGGDWYLASVQRKIWLLWNQQIRTGPQLSVIVSFTILPDGNVEDVHIVQSSSVYLLDQAAQRAIYSAAPFGPLPKHYAKKRHTIHAVFKPLS